MTRTREDSRSLLHFGVTSRIACALLASSLMLGAASCGSSKADQDEPGGGGDDDEDDDEGPTPIGSRDGGSQGPGKPAIDVCNTKSKVDKQRAADAGTTPATPPPSSGSESKSLYYNDFESPAQPIPTDEKRLCGSGLLFQDPINTTFKSDEFTYDQLNTVETVILNAPGYTDSSGEGGKYAIGMLSEIQDDALALSFKTTLPFLNVGFDLASVDQSCGTSSKAEAPEIQLSIYETPETGFTFGNPGRLLQRVTVSGKAPRNGKTFDWTKNVQVLSASRATLRDGVRPVTLMFNASKGGYAVIDNLSIVESSVEGVVDRDGNGVPDDQQCAER